MDSSRLKFTLRKLMHELYLGDCLQKLKEIPDSSVDFVLADPPYAANLGLKWDKIIPFELLWPELLRVTKDNSAIAIFGKEPFSSHLRLSNLKMFKYDWIWVKNRAFGFFNAKNMPMTSHELISVFSNGACANGSGNMMVYYPQDLKPLNKVVRGNRKSSKDSAKIQLHRASHKESRTQEFTNYPTQILNFPLEPKTEHPTQKPVQLLRYLIRTYSLEGCTVLDFCMGSGSTGVAAGLEGRNFIGIEKEEKFFELAKKRIENS